MTSNTSNASIDCTLPSHWCPLSCFFCNYQQQEYVPGEERIRSTPTNNIVDHLSWMRIILSRRLPARGWCSSSVYHTYLLYSL
mmetsp:Transcript_13401/g.37056  ORF Transcript_13401/g.37056 Transcript_13401/m.37056 type:complete len:83 (+) Transcript_13401:859-1107(+)